MRRYLPIVVVVLVAVIAVLWIQLGRRPASAPATKAASEAPQPLGPQPAYLKVVDAFMADWAKDDAAGVYSMLTDNMKKLITQQEFSEQMLETKISNPRTVAHTEIANAAFVIEAVDAPQPKGVTPVNGYSMLLRKQAGEWKVALFVAEEKIAKKYEDLKITPGKDKGYVVTYQDEQGQIATLNLQEP
jgi:hypothetical protein